MNDDRKVALVVPTIRENCFRDFVDRWGRLGLFERVHLIVMEDNPTRTFDVEQVLGPYPHFTSTHLCWEDVDDDLGESSWVIPRRSDTVRSYGYLHAWRQGYDFVLTLDDDVYPPTADADSIEYNGPQFVDEHLTYLTKRSRWYNTLNSVKPRGVPYYNVGQNDKVIVNHGLWTNVLDYDAPTQLVRPKPEQFSFDNRVVPAGMYFPMCGMNVMWRGEATVLMYHLLMGQVKCTQSDAFRTVDGVCQPILERLQFDRMGDIWCGIFMKKLADMCGYQVSSGLPYARHERASNPFTNLKKEANGIEVNERLWQYVDGFSPSLDLHYDAGDFPKLYGALGEHVEAYDEFPEHRDYFRRLGVAMRLWAKLFEEAP